MGPRRAPSRYQCAARLTKRQRPRPVGTPARSGTTAAPAAMTTAAARLTRDPLSTKVRRTTQVQSHLPCRRAEEVEVRGPLHRNCGASCEQKRGGKVGGVLYVDVLRQGRPKAESVSPSAMREQRQKYDRVRTHAAFPPLKNSFPCPHRRAGTCTLGCGTSSLEGTGCSTLSFRMTLCDAATSAAGSHTFTKTVPKQAIIQGNSIYSSNANVGRLCRHKGNIRGYRRSPVGIHRPTVDDHLCHLSVLPEIRI